MTNGMFNGMFGRVQSGLCRLSMNGGIAIKTSNGYKSYNVKTGRLTNCTNFVFNIGEEFFFVIPTNKVAVGDIILVSGKPRCVIEANSREIRAINYEDSTIETILPERHVFMGNTYFYGKIVSMFGDNFMGGKNGMKKMMSYMVMSSMLKDSTASPMAGSAGGNMSSMMPFFLMQNGGFSDMFNGMFEDGEDSDDIDSFSDESIAVEEEVSD